MKELTIDNSHNNVVCYDSVNLFHATDNQIIKLSNNSKDLDYIELLCRLWDFNKNERLIYKYIINALFAGAIPHSIILTKLCSINTGKNRITYIRALDSLSYKGILVVKCNGDIILNDDYNIYNYINNGRNPKQIKYITLKI